MILFSEDNTTAVANVTPFTKSNERSRAVSKLLGHYTKIVRQANANIFSHILTDRSCGRNRAQIHVRRIYERNGNIRTNATKYKSEHLSKTEIICPSTQVGAAPNDSFDLPVVMSVERASK